MMDVLAIILLLLGLAVVGTHLWTRRLSAMAEQLVPRAGQVQPVSGGSIHYVESGSPDAPPVVLIHGLSGQLQNFTYALTEKLAENFRVIALDRPGCGYSERSDDRTSLPAQAAMIAEFLDKRGVSDPVVVGHSLGGAVALALALDFPDKVAALALICPLTQQQSSAPDVFKGLEVRSPTLRRLIANTIAAPMAKRTAEVALTEVFKPEPWPEDFLTAAGGALGLRQKGFISASEDLVAAEAAMPVLAGRYKDELKVPGGVLYGAEDNILSPEKHGTPMEQFGLSYETIPERGHMIPLTEPEKVADFISRMAQTTQSKTTGTAAG